MRRKARKEGDIRRREEIKYVKEGDRISTEGREGKRKWKGKRKEG